MIDEYKNKNGGWRKLSEKVWAKVDIPTGIKFGALENEANEEEVIESPEEREGQENGLEEQQVKTSVARSDEVMKEKEAEPRLKEAPELIEESDREIQHRREIKE
uniref:Uncharacterized protein n=1 Tax=Solanum tuberosum TaxID=4113 RepID=M1DN87_SOLTU